MTHNPAEEWIRSNERAREAIAPDPRSHEQSHRYATAVSRSRSAWPPRAGPRGVCVVWAETPSVEQARRVVARRDAPLPTCSEGCTVSTPLGGREHCPRAARVLPPAARDGAPEHRLRAPSSVRAGVRRRRPAWTHGPALAPVDRGKQDRHEPRGRERRFVGQVGLGEDGQLASVFNALRPSVATACGRRHRPAARPWSSPRQRGGVRRGRGHVGRWRPSKCAALLGCS